MEVGDGARESEKEKESERLTEIQIDTAELHALLWFS